MDGWNRNRACEMAGVQPRTQNFVEHDPVEFVIRKNGLRRQLTASQKAIIAVTVSDWRERGRPTNSDNSLPGRELTSNADLASQIGVSTATIEHAKAAVRAGLAYEVRTGEMSAKKAAAQAKPKKPTNTESSQKKPKLSGFQKEQAAHARTKQKLADAQMELRDVQEKLDVVIVELESFADANGELIERQKKFKDLHLQIETFQAQLNLEVDKSAGFLRENESLRRQLRRYEG